MNEALRNTREAWLEQAIDVFRPRFKEVEYPLPDRIHVSVGFAYGAKRESAMVMGQTWRREASEDGVNHVFISPELGDTFDVMETLLHELIHVADNVEHGHRGTFVDIASALGFTKPWTETPAGPALQAELVVIAAELGEYPHGALHPKVPAKVPVSPTGEPVKLHSGPAKQGTRMRAIKCPACGYTARTTAKWLAVGLPTCPCGTGMVEP